jgi:hypothetical protein
MFGQNDKNGFHIDSLKSIQEVNIKKNTIKNISKTDKNLVSDKVHKTVKAIKNVKATKPLKVLDITKALDHNNNDESNKEIIPVKKITKPSKASLYGPERKKFLSDLMNTIGLSDTQKFFYLYDIDNNKEMQKKVLDMSADARQYFNSAGWGLFSKDNIHRPYMSLIRCALKDMGVKYTVIMSVIERNKKKIKSSGFLIT